MSARDAYKQAADYFVGIAKKVREDQWDAPGLGEWSIRELVAHTTRAMMTVEQYAATPGSTIELDSPFAYYRKAMSSPNINQAVADRGRKTVGELGLDLLASIQRVRDRVFRLIDSLPDDFIFGTTTGAITLTNYLPTRTVELIVHTLDIETATGIDVPPPKEAMRITLHVLADLAVLSPHAGRLALLATGRDAWQGSFTVLG